MGALHIPIKMRNSFPVKKDNQEEINHWEGVPHPLVRCPKYKNTSLPILPFALIGAFGHHQSLGQKSKNRQPGVQRMVESGLESHAGSAQQRP